VLREDMTDVVLAICSENLAEILSSLYALGRQPVDVLSIGRLGRLFAVANQVEDGRGLERI
jgi:hypothetical protein